MVFVLIGLAAGVLSGLFGIGGGILIVPALMWLGDFPVKVATATSLAALLLPVGALGAWEYYKQGMLRAPAAMLVAAGLFVGAWFGAKLAVHMEPRLLQRGFAVFIVIAAIRLWVKA